jgi:hypothetical protein
MAGIRGDQVAYAGESAAEQQQDPCHSFVDEGVDIAQDA